MPPFDPNTVEQLQQLQIARERFGASWDAVLLAMYVGRQANKRRKNKNKTEKEKGVIKGPFLLSRPAHVHNI